MGGKHVWLSTCGIRCSSNGSRLALQGKQECKNLFKVIGFVVLVIVAFIMMFIGKTVIAMM